MSYRVRAPTNRRDADGFATSLLRLGVPCAAFAQPWQSTGCRVDGKHVVTESTQRWDDLRCACDGDVTFLANATEQDSNSHPRNLVKCRIGAQSSNKRRGHGSACRTPTSMPRASCLRSWQHVDQRLLSSHSRRMRPTERSDNRRNRHGLI